MGETVTERGISGYVLKLAALCSMVIDHTAATVLYRILLCANAVNYPFVSAHWDEFNDLYNIMRGVGRVAFPIYCFLIVEGFLHTRSVAKYAARLFVFALLSEVPFDLALENSWWDMGNNNVFFTLLLGLLVISGIRCLNTRIRCQREDGSIRNERLFLRGISNAAVIFTGMALAEYVLRCDYGATGIIVIVVLYLLRSHPKTAYIISVVLLSLLLSDLELTAIFGLLLIAAYNGRRGRQTKYLFYAVYPLHLLLLAGICALLGIG